MHDDPKLREHAAVYPEVRFAGFTRVDGTIAFYSQVNALVEDHFTVLDIGCGRGGQARDPIRYRRNLRTLRGKVRNVIGIDIDREAKSNPLIDEFRLLDQDRWPVEDETVDLAYADHVLEHVETPDSFFREAARVLKPGGYLCIRAPNVRSYFGLISRMVPNSYHGKVASRVQTGRSETEYYPTYYRCNTQGRVKKMLRKHGFDAAVFGYEAEPTYFAFSRILYRLAVVHQKLAPEAIKIAIFAFGRRVASSQRIQNEGPTP